MPYIFLLPLTQ